MPVGRVIALFAALALGAALGLTSVWLAVRSGVAFGAVRAGPWVAYPRAAGLDRDPYAAALVARSGQTPLDIAEGVAFVALADSDGRALDGACEYRVSGAVPRARFWTLAATDARGALSDNPAGRHGFTSTELVRDEAGAFQVSVSPQARAGNWLPTTGLRRVALALRLYDASVSAGAAALKASDLPRIEKAGCG